MLDAGLTPHTALKSATLEAAIALGVDRDYGPVETGKVADFVVTRQNPLSQAETLSEPAGVVFTGHYLDRNSLTEFRSGHNDAPVGGFPQLTTLRR